VDPNEFNRNVSAHTAEELAPYRERYVAWSMNGTQVLAHAGELTELFEEVERRRITDYVLGYVPGDESQLGGGFEA